MLALPFVLQLSADATLFVQLGSPSHQVNHHSRQASTLRRPTFLKETQLSSSRETPCRHAVYGVECVEVPMNLPTVGRVVVLEATAESQEVLVNMALEDNIPNKNNKVIQQLNAGDPYGTVLWPAAYAVAAKILTESSYRTMLPNLTFLELGAGTGLVSLALSLAGAKEIIATDYEDYPLRLLEYAATNLNPINAKNHPIKYQLLDMRDYNTPLPPADVVVAADIMYEPKTGRAMAHRAVEALKRGSKVLVGDSPGRAGRTAFLQELERLQVVNASFTDTVGYTCSGPRHDLICGPTSMSISETPQELMVAVMELDPKIHLPDRN